MVGIRVVSRDSGITKCHGDKKRNFVDKTQPGTPSKMTDEKELSDYY